MVLPTAARQMTVRMNICVYCFIIKGDKTGTLPLFSTWHLVVILGPVNLGESVRTPYVGRWRWESFWGSSEHQSVVDDRLKLQEGQVLRVVPNQPADCCLSSRFTLSSMLQPHNYC